MEALGGLLNTLYACVDRADGCESFLQHLREVTGAQSAEWWWLPAHAGAGQPELRGWSAHTSDSSTTPQVVNAQSEAWQINVCRVIDTGDDLGLFAHPADHSGVEFVRLQNCPEPIRPLARRLLDALLPHIVRSCELHRQIQPPIAPDTRVVSPPILDMLNVGVILIDQCLGVRMTNRYADEVLAGESAGLTLSGNQLRALRDESIDQQLQASLNAAAQDTVSPDNLPQSAILVDEPEAQVCCIIWIWSLDGRPPGAGMPPADALVLVTDLNRDPTAPEAALRECFGLTVTEARIARQLLCGKTARDLAVEFNQREGTIRQHIKAILQKTRTRRQAELVRVLSSAFSIFRT